MTEQPVETEQQFLGNAPRLEDAILGTFVGAPLNEGQRAVLDKAMQHYVPRAHLRRPTWTPGDDVELTALVRNCTNANKLLAITKAEAKKAEDALSLALLVEDEAALAVRAADEALIAFTRKDTGL